MTDVLADLQHRAQGATIGLKLITRDDGRRAVALSIVGDGEEADPAMVELDPSTSLILGADLRLLGDLAG